MIEKSNRPSSINDQLDCPCDSRFQSFFPVALQPLRPGMGLRDDGGGLALRLGTGRLSLGLTLAAALRLGRRDEFVGLPLRLGKRCLSRLTFSGQPALDLRFPVADDFKRRQRRGRRVMRSDG
jgi:hypothetical protein